MNHSYRVDLCRVIAIIMIMGLHICDHGGVLRNTDTLGLQYELFGLYECFCIAGVNIFALISGYVLYNKSFKLSQAIKLWIKVLFFSITVSLTLKILYGYSFSFDQMTAVFFPILKKHYWYPTVYMGLYFISPFLSEIINKCDKEFTDRLLVMLLFILSVVPTLVHRDLLDVPTGSVTWLGYLFLIGAYIRRYNELPFLKRWYGLKWFVIFAIALQLSRTVIDYIVVNFLDIGPTLISRYFISNTSFIVYFQAVALFYACVARMREPQNILARGLLKLLGGSAFTTYLIHENFLFRELIVKDRFVEWAHSDSVLCVFHAIIISLIVYAVCTFINQIYCILAKGSEKYIDKIDRYNHFLDFEKDKQTV